MSFFKNIKFDELSEVDKSIYNYLANNINKVIFMRVRDVAQASHTSPSSVMRFVRHLGYESFPEFRLSFKADSSELPSEALGENILSQDNFPHDLDEKLEKVAELVMNSENIVFFGVGTSSYTAEYAARLFAMLGFNTTAFTDSTYPVFQKLENTSDNIFVVLSITGNTSEIIEIMNGVKNSPDYTSVAITADAASQLAYMCRHVLNYSVRIRREKRYQDFTSQIPAMYMIERLLAKVQGLQELS